MAVLPPAAGAGAEILLIGLGILALASLVVALGVQAGYQYTIGTLLESLASALDAVPLPGIFHIGHPLSPVAKQVRRANAAVFALIGYWIFISERGAVYLFEGVARIAEWMARETAQLAKDVFKALRAVEQALRKWFLRYLRALLRPLVRVIVRNLLRPFRRVVRWIAQRVRGLLRLARRLPLLVAAALRRLIPKLMRLLARFLNPLMRRLRRLFARLIRGLLRTVRRLLKLVRALARRIPNLRKLLRYLEHGLPWRAFLRLFLRALAKLDLGWLRGRNVIQVGKWLVRQTFDVIDGLLALIGVVGGTMSIEEFAELMIDVEDEVAEVTQRFWEAA